jgi:hypothetical protein
MPVHFPSCASLKDVDDDYLYLMMGGGKSGQTTNVADNRNANKLNKHLLPREREMFNAN